MKKRIRAIVYGTILVLTAVGVRECDVAGKFSGIGGGSNSPNQRFIAVGGTLEGEKFWGGKYVYYEFIVKTRAGDLVSYCKLNNPRPPLANWREEGQRLVQWLPDSSSVTFNFNGGHLTLSVNP